MSDHYVVVGKAESDTVDFADSVVKLVEVAKNNPLVAAIAGIGFGVLSITLLVAAWHYSSHS